VCAMRERVARWGQWITTGSVERVLAQDAELIARHARFTGRSLDGASHDTVESTLRGIQLGAVTMWLENCRAYGAPAHDDEERARAVRLIVSQRLSQAEVASLLDKARETRFENMMVISVPVADVKMDINCAGLMFGIGHLVLLIWLYAASKQELLLLDMVCQKMRDGFEIVRYRSFFVPSTGDATPTFRRVLRLFVLASVLVPLVLTALFVIWDYYTLGQSEILGIYPNRVLISYIAGESLMLMLGMYSCYKIAQLYDLLTKMTERNFVAWEEMSRSQRLAWLLERVCKVNPTDARQVDGVTMGDLLWMHYGVTDSDVAEHLTPVLVAEKPGSELILNQTEIDEMEKKGMGWIVDDTGKVRRLIRWSGPLKKEFVTHHIHRRFRFDLSELYTADFAEAVGIAMNLDTWRSAVLGPELKSLGVGARLSAEVLDRWGGTFQQ
jgi:hypothetical protein